jgi:hypothetical protein
VSVSRVAAQPDGYPGTPTPANRCFSCSKYLLAGEVVVVWVGGGAHICWHAECAKDWAAPFMRDVWEAKQIAKGAGRTAPHQTRRTMR